MDVVAQRNLANKLREAAEVMEKSIEEALVTEVTEAFNLPAIHDHFYWKIPNANCLINSNWCQLRGVPKNEFGEALIAFYREEKNDLHWKRYTAIEQAIRRIYLSADSVGGVDTEFFMNISPKVIFELFMKPETRWSSDCDFDAIWTSIEKQEQSLQQQREFLENLRSVIGNVERRFANHGSCPIQP